MGAGYVVREPDHRQQAIEPLRHPPGARAQKAQDDRLQQQPDQRGVQQDRDGQDEAHLLWWQRAGERERHEHHDHDRRRRVDHAAGPGDRIHRSEHRDDRYVRKRRGLLPGDSLNAPGGEHSYGNPLHDTGDLEILSGPQELVGQKGTYDVRFAGAALRGVYSFE